MLQYVLLSICVSNIQLLTPWQIIFINKQINPFLNNTPAESDAKLVQKAINPLCVLETVR